MKKRIVYCASLIVAIILIIISTIIVILNRTNTKTYYLNDNKSYSINEYEQIIKDINVHNDADGLYLVPGYVLMHINESGEILELNLTFVNSDNTKWYFLDISDNENILRVQNNKDELDKIISINDYFNVCNLGIQKFNNRELWIDFNISMMKIISNSPIDFIYENKEIAEISNEVQGEFYEFKFKDTNNVLMYVYVNNGKDQTITENKISEREIQINSKINSNQYGIQTGFAEVVNFKS